MLNIIHRVNTIKSLLAVPKKYGVEIDVRAYNNKLILNHEPFVNGDSFEEYLKNYTHAFAIFNIKEAGIEDKVLALAKKYKVKKFFLLDVEYPYLYRAARQGFRNIAVRYSEHEPIQNALEYKKFLDWVWIDCNTTLPLNKSIIKKLSGFKTCLVSPERWGRPEEIMAYKQKMSRLHFTPDAVMTDLEHVNLW